jgi:tetratricopeptide (TPR) repeat protein
LAIDFDTLFGRILETVDAEAYLTPTDHVDGDARAVLDEVRSALGTPGFDPDRVRALVHTRFEQGRIDRVHKLSALHVVACHPRVADWEEAARLAGEQELAALERGGPHLQANLASVDRHRGVLAFLRGHYEVALEYFTRALERQRTAENLSNILCTLLRLHEEDEAWSLLRQVRSSFPQPLVTQIDHTIQVDPDLALLRSEDAP